MTIMTLGGCCRAELVDLSVEGVEVGRCDLLMALPALVDDLELESLAVRTRDRVSRVTVRTGRKRLVPLVHGGGMDALLKLFVDAIVTARASLWNVLGVDGRLRVAGWQHPVRGVAVRAHGGDHEAALEQALAVDALGVVLNDVVLPAGVTQCGLVSLAMALAAQAGHIG